MSVIVTMNRKRSGANLQFLISSKAKTPDTMDRNQSGDSDEEAAPCPEPAIEIIEENPETVQEYQVNRRNSTETNRQHIPLVSLMEEIWTENSLDQMIPILNVAQKLALTMDFAMRRIFLQARTLWKKVQQTISEQGKQAQLKDCLWSDFEQDMLEDESFTMLCLLNLTKVGLKIWHQSVEKALTEEQSSSSRNTETTTTSSTTVRMPEAIAAVPLSIDCEGDRDVLEEVLANGIMTQTTGLIQQSISTIKNGKSFTLKTPVSLNSYYIIIKILITI